MAGADGCIESATLNGVDTPEQFRQFIRNDIDRWNRLIDVTGVKRGKP